MRRRGDRVRLCVLAETYPSTTQTFVYEPVAWLREAGHDVRVIATTREEIPGTPPGAHPSELVPPWIARGEKLRRLAAAPARSLAALAGALRWRGRSTWTVAELVVRASLPALADADQVLAHFGHMGASWLPAVGAAGRPYAVYFHGFDATAYLRERPGAYADLVASGAGALTNSRYLQGVLERIGFPTARIGVVPLAAAGDLATAAPPLLESRCLLTIARLVPKKGVADSLRAFAAAQPALQGRWRYRIVGDGPLRAELESLTAALGVASLVEFTGFLPRDATLAALREASGFVLASRTAESGDTEGTPVSIIEAATLGLPVVSTRHAGIPELLPPEAGALGYLVAEGDVAGLAVALGRLADPVERRRWGGACRALGRARHSPAAHVAALTDALARLAAVPR
jgi:colanic acid/amylovoran biosynthesis glycosyltransferase